MLWSLGKGMISDTYDPASPALRYEVAKAIHALLK